MRITKILSVFFPESAESFFDSLKFGKNSIFDYSQGKHLNIETTSESKKQVIIDFTTSPTDLKIYSDLKYTQKPNLSHSSQREFLTHLIATFHMNLIEVGIEQIKLESIKEIDSDFSKETQGLEWLRVSIEVLIKGMKHCMNNNDLAYEQLIFSQEIKSGYEMRLRVLSLDFKIIFLRDSRLEVTCWNFKDSTNKSGDQAPAFKGYFYHQKNQVLNLFIPLIKEMSQSCSRLSEL